MWRAWLWLTWPVGADHTEQCDDALPVKRRRGIKRRFHRVTWQFSGLCSNEFAEVHALGQAVVLQSARVRRPVSLHVCTLAPAFVLASLLTACAVGPEYSPAPAPVPTEFKELK